MKNGLWRVAAGAALIIVASIAFYLLGVYAGVNRVNPEAGVAADPRHTVSAAESLRHFREFHFSADLARCVKLSKAQKEYVFSATMTDYQSQSYLLEMASTPDEIECQDGARRFCESHYPGDCLAVPGEVEGHLN